MLRNRVFLRVLTQDEQKQKEKKKEKRSKAGMQALSPTHSLYNIINARNQIRNKAALKSRGFRSNFISGSHSIKGFHNAVS